MRNRNLNPVIQQNLHLFIKDRNVYGMALNTTQQVSEVDFEEDHWRHES